ncbi:MAG TPA: N-acetylmuramoyl-L-alanine amidase, partial [Candidatus Binatia bacterium]|nr:N-acetylmuramoyl-L-alanine amidase [Candidatus Binatia bacterium]
MRWSKTGAGLKVVALCCALGVSGAAPQQESIGDHQAIPSSTAPTESRKRTPEFFVMIDPSHGGNDKGATLGGKLAEKDITLRLAREVRKELEERGIAARLLRESDIDLSLDRRAEITNEQR